MSKHNYPREMPGEWSTARSRPGCAKCKDCGRVSRGDERIFIRETQVSYMRGDDFVNHWCEGCATNAGHQPPPTREQNRLGNIKCLKTRIQKLERELGQRRAELARLQAKGSD